VQAEAQDRDEKGAGEQQGDRSPAARPPVRAATPEVRGDGARFVKYPTMGVLHDFTRSDGDFCRV